jgi:predicted nuclease of restriction endonuclease-like RecB superfamily
LFPQLVACDEFELEADVRWGKQRTPLLFHYRAELQTESVPPSAPPQEIQELVRRVSEGDSGWKARPNDRILDLPGVGVVVPDLLFTRGDQTVYLELLGYWSRDAVWKRVEIVRRGFPHKIVFALSSRLRVSEEVLEESDEAALLVYKGTLSVNRVLAKVAAVASR